MALCIETKFCLLISNGNLQNDSFKNFKISSSDDITLDFTKSMISMYRFGGNEYFLTEKIFSLQDLLSTILLNLVLGKLGRVKQNLNLFSISHLYLMHCWI
jgi:hypothetical protein